MDPQVPPVEGQRQRISELLSRAAAAHRQYESVILKQPDPNWANWEATFAFVRDIQKYLPGEISQDQLSRWLAAWAEDYARNGGELSEPDYFAQRLLEALK